MADAPMSLIKKTGILFISYILSEIPKCANSCDYLMEITFSAALIPSIAEDIMPPA